LACALDAELEDPDAGDQRDHRYNRDDLIDQVLLARWPYRNCRGGGSHVLPF
jgi:hypothetical protein